jgi:hypothetical protein
LRSFGRVVSNDRDFRNEYEYELHTSNAWMIGHNMSIEES